MVQLIYLIIIPLILGFTYFIVFPLVSGRETEVSTIGVEGGIYENYITNYLPFIPIFLTFIIASMKSKDKKQENNFPTIMFMLSVLFAIILFIGNKLEIVSDYYFFKAYYIIWSIFIYNVYVAISYIFEEKSKRLKIVTCIYIAIYLLLIIVGTLILKKNIGINDIFYYNLECVKSELYILKNEELEIIEKEEDIITGEQTYILASSDVGRMRWMSVLCHNQQVYIDGITCFTFDVEEWLTEKEEKYYFAYYNEYMQIEENIDFLDENSDKYEIIYNDEHGFILERK